MNRLVLFLSQEVSKHTFEVTDPGEMAHLVDVLKLREGDSLRVALVDKGIGMAKVLSVEKDRVLVVLQGPLEAQTPILDIRILAGLARPRALRRMLEQGTAMEVSSFVFFAARGSEKSYAQSKVLRQEHYRKALLRGLAQSKSLFALPSVSMIQGWARGESFGAWAEVSPHSRGRNDLLGCGPLGGEDNLGPWARSGLAQKGGRGPGGPGFYSPADLSPHATDGGGPSRRPWPKWNFSKSGIGDGKVDQEEEVGV